MKRESIIETAYQEFLKNGYLNTTIKDILQIAKVSRGGFYHHFNTKEDLLLEVMEKYYLDQINQSVHFLKRCSSYSEYIDHLCASLEAHSIEITESNNLLSEYYFMLEVLKNIPLAADTMDKLYAELLEIYIDFITRQMETGELRKDTNARHTAQFLISFIEGNFLMSAISPNSWSHDYAHEILGLHYNSITEN
jgi:AcrR family transcriptional regulator